MEKGQEHARESSQINVCRYESSCLDNGIDQNHSRLLGDDLFGGEMMLDELRDGGEAGSFKTVLTLDTREI